MRESRDPAIKLFGQKIPLPGEGELSTAADDDESGSPESMEVDGREGGEEESDGGGAGERRNSEEKDEEDKVRSLL